MQWYNPHMPPFRVDGFAFYEQDKQFQRLPLRTELELPEAVRGLGYETVGGQLRFHAVLKKLSIEVSLMARSAYFAGIKTPHLALTAKSGFDLYLSKDGKNFIFYGVSKGIGETDRTYQHTFFELDQPEEFEILLNFPLYDGVDSLVIGTDDEAVISTPQHHYISDDKLVFYGTSIQQGACAGRPGMAGSNLLSRWLNREVYNFGFNSSGRAEKEMAELLRDIQRTAALLVSIEGNCPDVEWLCCHLPAFLAAYRQKQPQTPIVLLPFIESGQTYLHPRRREEHAAFMEAQQRIVAERRSEGDRAIYLYDQQTGLESDMDGHSVWHESTVDGLHYNDLGFYWLTQGLYRFLRETLGF